MLLVMEYILFSTEGENYVPIYIYRKVKYALHKVVENLEKNRQYLNDLDSPLVILTMERVFVFS